VTGAFSKTVTYEQEQPNSDVLWRLGHRVMSFLVLSPERVYFSPNHVAGNKVSTFRAVTPKSAEPLLPGASSYKKPTPPRQLQFFLHPPTFFRNIHASTIVKFIQDF
jgi:hypothetical protein